MKKSFLIPVTGSFVNSEIFKADLLAAKKTCADDQLYQETDSLVFAVDNGEYIVLAPIENELGYFMAFTASDSQQPIYVGIVGLSKKAYARYEERSNEIESEASDGMTYLCNY